MKVILICFGVGLISFLLGYEICERQLGQTIYEAIEHLDRAKVVMLKSEDLFKRMQDEVHDTINTDHEEK